MNEEVENELYGTIIRLIRLFNRPDLIWERLGMGNILRKWFPTLEPQSLLKQTVLVLGEYISGQLNLLHLAFLLVFFDYVIPRYND